MDPELERLAQFDEKIQEIARGLGLDFFPQEFDVIPAQKMLEIMAYRFPVNVSHWSFGRDYEREKTQYEYGLGIPYEVVLNSNPSRAYLMSTNPLPVQVMVTAPLTATYPASDTLRVVATGTGAMAVSDLVTTIALRQIFLPILLR